MKKISILQVTTGHCKVCFQTVEKPSLSRMESKSCSLSHVSVKVKRQALLYFVAKRPDISENGTPTVALPLHRKRETQRCLPLFLAVGFSQLRFPAQGSSGQRIQAGITAEGSHSSTAP